MTMALGMISVFIAALLKKNNEISSICAHILISLVSHNPEYRVLLLQHPSEIVFLNKKTAAWSLGGAAERE